jgi:DNA helicase-2/ATP-dependent DNA helicase PcrA
MDSILHGLNEQQKCAVTSIAPVLQVLAPPGSGKTKTLTARVAYLIAHHGLRPGNMIVCTFTIKAAREMKDRIRHFIGDELESKLVLGTFHSVARRYLMAYGEYINIPKNFGIADSSDSLAIIKRLITRHSFLLEPSKARSRISRRKSTATATTIPAKRTGTANNDTEKLQFEELFDKYEAALKDCNLLDYDDLLLQCVELLRRHPECVSNVEAVLIDEFQDTNTVQYEIMRHFSQRRPSSIANGAAPSITIVGDPDQSIYSFRFAEIENLNKMTKQYPETHVVVLEHNYRSSASILTSALEVIEQDVSRPAKKMMSTHCVGEMPVLRMLPSSGIEALWIVLEVKRLVGLNGGLLNYSDFAILLRSASLSRQIEAQLGKAGIPYRMVGGHKFFDRVEVKVLLDYLRVVIQPQHTQALMRVINVPSRKIGETTIKALLEEAESKHWTLWKLILSIARGQYRSKCKVSAQAQNGIDCFVNVILTSQDKLAASNSSQSSIVDLLEHVMQKLSYETYLRRSYPQEFENRWDNVQELIIQASAASSSVMGGMELETNTLATVEGVEQQEYSCSEQLLTTFLANVALSTQVESGKDSEVAQQLTISTIHAAKGLEWPVVMIPAVYEGSIPHSRAEDIDEERRLLYVGMTRAKSLLYLSWPKKSSSGEETKMSPFLSHKRMSRFFAPTGPPISYTVTQDIARILARECPPPTIIEEAISTVEHQHDDGWLEEGKYNEDGEQKFGGFGASTECPSYPSLKRQKFNHKSSGFGTSSRTTVIQLDSYSVSNTTVQTGFVSASTWKKELDVLEKDVTVPERSKVAEMRDSKKPGRKLAKEVKASQGSIMSFFSKPTKTAEQEIAAEPELVRRDHERTDPRPQLQPLPGVVNLKIPSKPTPAPISDTFASHKLRMTPSTPLQRPISREENTSPSRYVLLSSSPPKPTEKDDPERAMEVPTVRATTTFHTTTMDMMQRQEPHRRTLGVRRSMVSWSAAQAQRKAGGRN